MGPPPLGKIILGKGGISGKRKENSFLFELIFRKKYTKL